MTQNSIWKMVGDLEDKNVILEQSVFRLEAQNAKLVEALEEIRSRGYPCEGLAYYLGDLANDALQQLNENCQHMNKEGESE